MGLVNFVETCLYDLDKLERLSKAKQNQFWAAKSWHPVVRMVWNSLIEVDSDLKMMTFPDGGKFYYGNGESLKAARPNNRIPASRGHLSKRP